MFDIGFSELLVIGVVALIVIGPERLPKVARTAGHLLGRFQRYASSVKNDISREMQMDELRKAGQSFRESVESVASGVESKATAVDDYLKTEAGHVNKVLAAMATIEGENPVTERAMAQLAGEGPHQDLVPDVQQSLDLDAPPATVVEYANRAHSQPDPS
jgi:sec-independent protein translocase protein TatB